MHNVNFFNIVEHRDGTYHAFEYKLDAVRAKFDDIRNGEFAREQASLSYGTFMW